MDYDEYEDLITRKIQAQQQLNQYIEAIETCYGKQIADSILDRASEIKNAEYY